MPLTVMVPEVGRTRSAIARSSVVLPQPDGPIRETNSPLCTRRSTLLSAVTGASAVWKVSERSQMSMATADAITCPVTLPARASDCWDVAAR